MVTRNQLLDEKSPLLTIDDEVIFLDNLQEKDRLPSSLPWKMEFNAIVHCRHGKILLEVGGNQEVKVKEGQLLLVPAKKLLQTMMVSTDVEAEILLVSDRVLKSMLGPQIDIWNRAMYLHETYVIDTQGWTEALSCQAHSLFTSKGLVFFKEIVYSFLRILLLIICEQLVRQERLDVTAEDENEQVLKSRERSIFQKFLNQLQKEDQKRQQVSYYAEKLCITPKYLSTVCRKVSGKSPIKWITESVMEDCYSLLRNTDFSVKEISNLLGFPNSSFFGQYFREQAGMTPLSFRNSTKSANKK